MKPRKVLVAVNDIFFASKIRGATDQNRLSLTFVKDAQQLTDLIRRETPDLVIFDLNDTRCCPLETIRHLKSEPDLASIELVGYLSHVQGDLQRKAEEAGCERVLPKSSFVRLLPSLLAGGA